MGKSVLLVDDDPELGRLVELALRPLDIAVHQAYSGTQGVREAFALHPDLIILDVVMPGMDGFDLCVRLREMASVPILMLTACCAESDMLRAFRLGADDYLRKPFSKNELEARVRALLRRANQGTGRTASCIHSYRDSVLDIDLTSQIVKLHGQIVSLSPREYEVLAYLVRETGRIVSARELSRELWVEYGVSNLGNVSLYVHYLRRKLEAGHAGYEYIRTSWGRGYRFEAHIPE